MWLCLLFIKLRFLQPNQQYVLIKIFKNNKSIYTIYQELKFEQRGERESKNRSDNYLIVIPPKNNNLDSITLAHSPVFYSKRKYIDIYHQYIYDKVALMKIDLLYISTD